MDLGSIFLILALLILVGLFIGRPLFENSRIVEKGQLPEDHDRSMLMAERDRILVALQELDFDFTLGKIPEEDYPQQRAFLLQKGADVLRALDALVTNQDGQDEQAEDRLEAAIALRRADAAKSAATAIIQNGVVNGNGNSTAVGARGMTAAITEPDDELEAILANRKRMRSDKSAGFCSQCGAPVQKLDRFCPKCG